MFYIIINWIFMYLGLLVRQTKSFEYVILENLWLSVILRWPRGLKTHWHLRKRNISQETATFHKTTFNKNYENVKCWCVFCEMLVFFLKCCFVLDLRATIQLLMFYRQQDHWKNNWQWIVKIILSCSPKLKSIKSQAESSQVSEISYGAYQRTYTHT